MKRQREMEKREERRRGVAPGEGEMQATVRRSIVDSNGRDREVAPLRHPVHFPPLSVRKKNERG